MEDKQRFDSYGAESGEVYKDRDGTHVRLLRYNVNRDKWKAVILDGPRKGRWRMAPSGAIATSYEFIEHYDSPVAPHAYSLEAGQLYRITEWGDSSSVASKRMVGRSIELIEYRTDGRWKVRYLDSYKIDVWYPTTIRDRCERVKQIEVTAGEGFKLGIGDDFDPFSTSYFNKLETKPMKNFEQKLVTIIRGKNADDMTDDDIFTVVTKIEAEIKRRLEMKTHSKTQQKMIAELERDKDNLVKFVDERNELFEQDK